MNKLIVKYFDSTKEYDVKRYHKHNTTSERFFDLDSQEGRDDLVSFMNHDDFIIVSVTHETVRETHKPLRGVVFGESGPHEYDAAMVRRCVTYPIITKDLQAKDKSVSAGADKDKGKDKEEINNHIFDEVIQLFNETLPGEGQIQHYRIHSDTDRRNFVDLIKKQPSFLDIENWRELFELIKDRPKLLGTHSSFNVVANLGWLFIEKNIADIFNGKYERESGASGRTPKTWEEHQREYEENRRKMGLA